MGTISEAKQSCEKHTVLHIHGRPFHQHLRHTRVIAMLALIQNPRVVGFGVKICFSGFYFLVAKHV